MFPPPRWSPAISSEDPDFDWPDLEEDPPPPPPKKKASFFDAMVHKVETGGDVADPAKPALAPEPKPEPAAQAPAPEVKPPPKLAPAPIAKPTTPTTPTAPADPDALYWPDEEPPEVIEAPPETDEHQEPARRIVYGPVPPPGPPRFDLIAIDLDGTLLRTDKKLSTFDLKSVREAVSRGVKVVIATARPPRSSRYVHEKLKLDTLMINYNGALIHDRLNNKHVQHNPLPRRVGRKIIERAREIEPKVVVSIEVLDKWYTDHDDPNLKTETARKFKPDFIGSLEVPLEFDLTKLMFLAHPGPLKKITKALSKEFAGQAVFHRSDEAVLQVAHRDVDKGVAVAWVAEQYGIPAEKCLAIGDAPNDAGMLRWAGLGCAMANAFGEARDAADVIVESNDHEGVGQAIEDYVL